MVGLPRSQSGGRGWGPGEGERGGEKEGNAALGRDELGGLAR